MLPILKILILWIIGILLIQLNPFFPLELTTLLVVFAVLFFIVSLKKCKNCKLIGNLLVVFLVVGVVQFLNFSTQDVSKQYLLQNTTQSVVLKVKELYKQTQFQNKYIVEVEAVLGDSITKVNQDYLLLQKRDASNDCFLPGNRIISEVFVMPFQIQKHEVLFDSKRFWNLKGVKANLWLKEENLVFLDSSTNWFYRLRKLQIEWLNLIDEQNIKPQSKEILSALLLGDKRGVSKEISTQFSRLGLVHTLSLSGLHVSLIYGICAFLLALVLKHQHRLQSFVLVVIIIIYAILTGLSPSVMRASLMFLLYAFSLLINRQTTAFNIVFLSALILLIYKPNLIYDVGFQLSYMAVIGIIYFYNKFKKYITDKSVIMKFIFGLALVSISAQLSTGLLSVYYFHSFPVSFLWANLIVLPLITLLLYQGLLYLALLVIDLNFNCFDVIIDVFVQFVLKILMILEKYSFAPLQVYISKSMLIASYGLLILVCIVFLEKHFSYLKFLYVYIVFFVLHLMFGKGSPKKELFVNGSSRAYVISVLANKEQVLISNNYESSSYLLGDYAMVNNVVCIDSLSPNTYYRNEFCFLSQNQFQFFDEQLLFLSDEKLNLNSHNSIEVLFMNKYRNDLKDLKKVFSPKVVLINPSISTNKRYELKRYWKDLNVEVIDLKVEAFVRTY